MKIVKPEVVHIDIPLRELTALFHICTYVSNDENCGDVLRAEARELARQLSSFDVNKLGASA